MPWRNTIKCDRCEKGDNENAEYSDRSPEDAAGMRAIQISQESRDTEKQGHGSGGLIRLCPLEDEMDNLQGAREISEAVSRQSNEWTHDASAGDEPE
jgi:hypothetical protein